MFEISKNSELNDTEPVVHVIHEFHGSVPLTETATMQSSTFESALYLCRPQRGFKIANVATFIVRIQNKSYSLLR
jgi:hypothetical protein